MQISQVPALLQKAWAASGTKNTIPVASQISVTPGAASLTDGFPPLTLTPLAAGGVPPFGADTNGILNWLSQICQWSNAGGQYLYDATFATAIGGYPKGATLLKADGTGIWMSTTDNNTTDPDASGAGWVTIASTASSLPVMSFATVNTLTADQGPILVSDRNQIATFTTSSFYTGYRSWDCGDWKIGSMCNAHRPHEIDGIGGIYDIADFPSLWGWANENGFVVPAASWVPSATCYSLIGTTQFRVPDYRNMFPRVAGTDADTANPRGVGSYQPGSAVGVANTGFPTGITSGGVLRGELTGEQKTGVSWTTTTSETYKYVAVRPDNAAVSPVILI